MRYEVPYGGDTMVVEYDGAQASAPILLDGEYTGFQVADGRHRADECIRRALHYAYGWVVETDDELGDRQGCSWESVAYEALLDEVLENEEP